MSYELPELKSYKSVRERIVTMTPYQMSKDYFFSLAELYTAQVINIMRAKNADYTGGRSPFENFKGAEGFGIDPLIGLGLRMDDKMQRIKSYCKHGSLQVENEGIEDAFRDLIGYSLLALGMLEEKRLQNSTTDDTVSSSNTNT